VRGSIFKQKHRDGSTSYGIVYDDHPESGKKRKQKRIRGFRTRKEADDRLTEIRAAVQRCGRYYEPTKLVVAEYIDKWVAEMAHVVRPRTLTVYEAILGNYVKPRLGHMPMWALQPQHVKELYDALLRDGRKRRRKRPPEERQGLHPRTVVHVHRVLHAMFAEAVRTQIVVANPCASIRPPRVPSVEQRVLNEAEVTQLLKAAEDDPMHAFVVVALSSGARAGELLALTWPYADPEAGRITIAYGQAKDGSLTELKTRRSRRTIVLPPSAASVLRAHKARQRLGAGESWSDRGLVFADRAGRPWLVASLVRKLGDILARAKLGQGVHPHTLRHTYASLALKGGVPVTTVSANLGHSSTATTLNVYAHHIPSTEDAAAQVMQRALAGVP
jgi:integrase